MLPRAIAIAASLAIAGCSSSDRLELVAGSSQEAIVRNGTPALISQKQHLVMLSPVARAVESHRRPGFTIVVKNLGAKPHTLTATNVTAIAQGPTRQAIKVFQYDELVKEEQDRQTTAAIVTTLGAIGGAMSAANAGYSTTTGSVSGNSYGRPYSGTYSSTTYNPYQAQMAQQAQQAQTASDFAALRQQGEANLERLNSSILKDHTVMPGEWYGGVIVLAVAQKDQQGSSQYTITVPFGGELHEFTVRQAKQN